MTNLAESWLQDYCEFQTGVRRGLVVRGQTGDRAQLLGAWPVGSPPDAELLAIAADTINGKYPIQRAVPTADGVGRAYPLPLRLSNQILGAVVIEVRKSCGDSDETTFDTLRQKLASLEKTLGHTALGGIGPAEVLSLQATLLNHHRFAPAATALANELAALLHCDRVSIGMVRNGATRLEAVSHSSTERHGGDDFLAIAAAMDECVDQQAAILYPQPSRAQPRITLAHAALAKRMGGGTLLTLPLVDRLQVFGAITIESLQGVGFAEEEVTKLEHMAGLIGPLLAVKREVGLPLRRRLGQRLADFWRRLIGPGHVSLKAATAGLALLLGLLTLIPVEYRVTAPVRLEGQVQRTLSAPTDGFLQVVHARPGDPVRTGQVLVELAKQDLLLELRRWQSELAQHENAYGAAMSSGDRAQLAVSLARMREAQAQVDLVQGQLARARIEAPFDGVVISGDLSQSLGTPVERGHALLTVAPVEGRRLIVEVDERDIDLVRVGQRGEFVLQAMPGRRLGLIVQRITPVASTADERNFFAVEASLIGADPGLRHGLEGVAKIGAGDRSLAWIWLHRAGDWLRLNLWRWLG